jgi:xylulose-5-phosphate/fructose-6-phosphate phosphoketolase
MTPVAAPETIRGTLSAYGQARSTISGTPLKLDELRKTHAYWRACNLPDVGHDLLTGQPTVEGTVKTGSISRIGFWGIGVRVRGWRSSTFT